MNPGTLDTRIEIQNFVTTRGAMGGQTETWQTFHNCWAKVTTNKGAEKISASKETAFGYTTFKIRYKQGITTAMQVVLDGETYHIKSINKLGRKSILELFTEKRT